jgi:hypothetical protein
VWLLKFSYTNHQSANGGIINKSIFKEIKEFKSESFSAKESDGSLRMTISSRQLKTCKNARFQPESFAKMYVKSDS